MRNIEPEQVLVLFKEHDTCYQLHSRPGLSEKLIDCADRDIRK
jgi:hypothetical protein